jgi:transporter family protein
MRIEPWIVYAFLAIFSWGIWGFVNKLVLERTSWASIIIYNLLGSSTILLAYMFSQGPPRLPAGTTAMLAVLSGILGAVGTTCFMLSLSAGRASIVVPLTSIYPVVTVALSVLLLGDVVSPRHAAGIAFAIIAVALLSLD